MLSCFELHSIHWIGDYKKICSFIEDYVSSLHPTPWKLLEDFMEWKTGRCISWSKVDECTPVSCGEETAKLETKAIHLFLHSLPQLWSQALDSDWKNKVAVLVVQGSCFKPNYGLSPHRTSASVLSFLPPLTPNRSREIAAPPWAWFCGTF